MGLLHTLETLVAEKPEALRIAEDPQSVYAPVSGGVIALEQLPDPVFSQGMLGFGAGVAPEGDVAYAPVSGVVTAEVKTRHALLIKAECGAEVLLHVGLDSVALRGAGMRQLVRKGDTVRAGEPIAEVYSRTEGEEGIGIAAGAFSCRGDYSLPPLVHCVIEKF